MDRATDGLLASAPWTTTSRRIERAPGRDHDRHVHPCRGRIDASLDLDCRLSVRRPPQAGLEPIDVLGDARRPIAIAVGEG